MVGYAPSEVLDVLHMITAESGRDSFATAAYALLDPTEHRLRWAAAGHLPLLQFDDGGARYIADVRNPPLGCPSPPIVEQVAAVPVGSGIVLVTDGLVESRSRRLDEGMDLLLDLVTKHAASSAEELTDLITDELCSEPEDDCCIVVLRRL